MGSCVVVYEDSCGCEGADGFVGSRVACAAFVLFD